MNTDFSSFISDVWRYKPVILVLLAGGLIMLVLLVIDTHRHRKKQKSRHKRLH